MFLIGFYVGRNMMYQKLDQYKPLFKKIMLLGFVIGIPACFATAWFDGDGKSIYKDPLGLLDTSFYAIGMVPLCLAYVCAICMYWIKTKGNNWLRIFAPVGRMALTNYLLQSIISIFIFYGAGLGYGQSIGPVYFIPIVFGIYILQIIFSNFWFRYFQYGPMEWIWRQLTYGRRLPLKKHYDVN